MTRGGLFLALTSLVCASALPVSAAAQARKAAPAKKAAPARAVARDWTKSVALTPEGGFRMGNPAAAVKLIEYGSMTCPTCARFTNAAKGQIAAKVRTGKVSFEFRNYVLNGIDVAASLLSRCSGTSRFFPMMETLYATQPIWSGKVASISQAQKDQLMALPEGQRIGRIAELTGLSALAAQHGVTAQQGQACLVDPAGLARLDRMAQAAEALGVHGTPTFFVNGKMVHAHDWGELEPLIRQAGG